MFDPSKTVERERKREKERDEAVTGTSEANVRSQNCPRSPFHASRFRCYPLRTFSVCTHKLRMYIIDEIRLTCTQ